MISYLEKAQGLQSRRVEKERGQNGGSLQDDSQSCRGASPQPWGSPSLSSTLSLSTSMLSQQSPSHSSSHSRASLLPSLLGPSPAPSPPLLQRDGPPQPLHLSSSSPLADSDYDPAPANPNPNPAVVFGDHWLLEAGELPSHLVVPIPQHSSWLGEVSAPCASLLRGLFELRPALRLGGRNIAALRTHCWLRERGVADWAALQAKTLAPFFRPGKRFIRDGFQPLESCDERRLDEARLLQTPLGQSPCHSLAGDFQQQFCDFHFVAPLHRAAFPALADCGASADSHQAVPSPSQPHANTPSRPSSSESALPAVSGINNAVHNTANNSKWGQKLPRTPEKSPVASACYSPFKYIPAIVSSRSGK
mmetsp:Transcript_30899/g.44384  ORF Transcript_30899/g.44384 Transcript_30899/m.44384 type:complete len:363 (-) Transcript_30899:152-1240(-)